MLVDNDLAYVLHCVPYRDNSVIAHFFTLQHGKVSFIINGIKSPKSTKRALLQPCRQLNVSYMLKPNLSKMTDIDFSHHAMPPAIEHFMLYQYAHEVLLHILPSQLPLDAIFRAYEIFLQQLHAQKPHVALRYFELALIEQFTGLPELTTTQDTEQAVVADKCYYFYPESGVCENYHQEQGLAINGENLLAFSHLTQRSSDDISETLAQGAQPISTFLIKQLLNGKQLKTRQIFKDLAATVS